MDRGILSWDPQCAKVVGFTTSGSKASKTTTVRIEMQVSDSWALSDLVRDLADLRLAKGSRP